MSSAGSIASESNAGGDARVNTPFAMLVRLHPNGPWRIGPDSGDRDRVDRIYHSDSLYSAVCGAMQRVGILEEWLDATARATESAVRFSSCFPYHANTLYVVPPKHLWPPPDSTKVRWKGASFVPLRAVETLVSGKALEEDGWVIDNECLMPSGTGTGLFRASVRSSAAVDRGGASVSPHSVACLEFTPQSGLWFVAAFADEAARGAWRDKLKGAIRLLADSGFGGERSRGWGRSDEPDFIEGRLPDLLWKNNKSTAANGHWMLSLFHPAESDAIDWTKGNYSLITRRGRVESEAHWGDLKKPARMVAEGSVLVGTGEPKGAAAEVGPENVGHPVYRAGFALSIAVPLNPHVVAPVKPEAAVIVDRTGGAETAPKVEAHIENETAAENEALAENEVAVESAVGVQAGVEAEAAEKPVEPQTETAVGVEDGGTDSAEETEPAGAKAAAEEPASKPVSEPVSEPAFGDAAEQLLESVAEPETEAAAEAISEAASESDAASTAEPATEHATESTTEPAAEAAAEGTTEIASEGSHEPAGAPAQDAEAHDEEKPE